MKVVRLLKGYAELTEREHAEFTKGDTIYGDGYEPEELQRWNIENEDDALAELGKLECDYYHTNDSWSIVEYALEYCEADEDGDLIGFSDIDMATEKEYGVDIATYQANVVFGLASGEVVTINTDGLNIQDELEIDPDTDKATIVSEWIDNDLLYIEDKIKRELSQEEKEKIVESLETYYNNYKDK